MTDLEFRQLKDRVETLVDSINEHTDRDGESCFDLFRILVERLGDTALENLREQTEDEFNYRS